MCKCRSSSHLGSRVVQQAQPCCPACLTSTNLELRQVGVERSIISRFIFRGTVSYLVWMCKLENVPLSRCCNSPLGDQYCLMSRFLYVRLWIMTSWRSKADGRSDVDLSLFIKQFLAVCLLKLLGKWIKWKKDIKKMTESHLRWQEVHNTSILNQTWKEDVFILLKCWPCFRVQHRSFRHPLEGQSGTDCT